jgi:hypothetical protein
VVSVNRTLHGLVRSVGLVLWSLDLAAVKDHPTASRIPLTIEVRPTRSARSSPTGWD